MLTNGPEPDISENSISLNQALVTFTKRWKLLVILALLFVLGALVKHKFFPTYPARGILLIKDVKNSRYQLLLSSIANQLGEFAPDEGQGVDAVSQAINFLDTYSFHKNLARKLLSIYENSENKNEIESLNLILKKISKIKDAPLRELRTAQILRAYLGYSNEGGGRLKVYLKTNNKKLSFLIVSVALEEAKKELVRRDIHELEEAEKYFSLQIKEVQGHLDKIEKETIEKMQKHQVLSVDIEKGETSRYQNELKQNISETTISIRKNNNLIRDLENKIKDIKSLETGRFSGSSQIKNLRAENKELSAKLKSLEQTLRGYGKKQKGLLPFQQEIEKMRAKYTYEYKVYESLRGSLAKIGLQKTYINNKIEVLEPEFLERIQSKPGLLIMVLLAFILSQIVGLSSIYLWELFRP
ncbi:MAG: hypothetical protein K9K67_08460 [Bacteriovoracaceae bacterium]|nr:hypothetical protein [Bacteriovoracaceae bacterium]